MTRIFRRLAFLTATTAMLAGVASAEARANALIADLSEHLVKIDMGFTGRKVLLFGAIEGNGEVVIVVRGPQQPITVRRKERVAGIWANKESVTFENAVSFYHVLASSEMDEWLPLHIRERHQIGVEYLRFTPREDIGPAAEAVFQTALIRNKQRLGHYGLLEGRISVIGDRLFRGEIFFPANVPTGIYSVDSYFLRHGRVVSAQKTPLYVSKSGIEAEVFRLAHTFPEIYGVLAIFIAVAAGLGANAAFSRR